MKISVVLATYNEESNIADCLSSVKDLVDEIIIVDGSSTDKTVEIAKSFGARVVVAKNHPIFHINKQKALDLAKNTWVLQLDADERVTKKLSDEILQIVDMTDEEINKYQNSFKKRKLFIKHQKLLESRDGKIREDTKEYCAFFIPRRNFFLGKYLRYGGVYPDGVIRLVKKDKAFFPCKSVHEQIVVKGKVGWLQNDLLHVDSPTFERYLEKNTRYINLIVNEFKKDNVGKDIVQAFKFFIFKPIEWFLVTQIRHKGILDGFQGIVFSFFSALRFPRAYIRYLKS